MDYFSWRASFHVRRAALMSVCALATSGFYGNSESAEAQSRPAVAAPNDATSASRENSAIGDLLRVEPLKLVPTGRLGPGARKENSGIVRSRLHDDLFWVQNDSGDEPYIYPIHRNGDIYVSERYPDIPGVQLAGAINVDWEDIAVDSVGHVIIADFGNNANDRRDLVLYYVDEPAPTAGRSAIKKAIFFRYPDQPAIPAPANDFNYDAEALFTLGNAVYILTKHRSDTFTKLYRLDEAQPHATNTLTYLDRFDVRGQAVAADGSADGRRFVIATYNALWLFDVTDPQHLFSGLVYWLPYDADEVEAVCFADDDTLLLASEEKAELYEVPIAKLKRIR